MLPVLIMYGIMTTASAVFYVMIPVACILTPLLPFVIATFFALPLMYIISFLKSKFVLMLISYVIIVAVGFIGYMKILEIILSILTQNQAGAVLTPEIVSSIKDTTYFMYPEVMIKNILLGVNLWKNFLSILLIGVVCVGGVAFIAEKIYVKVLLNNVESELTFLHKKIKIKKVSVSAALFKREFINIFRSVNYSFQYLAVVLTTPLMVYFSNSICSKIGAEKLGDGILPSIGILIIIMFLSLAVSFSASSLTREGDKFFHTKIIPVTFKKQMTIKLLLYMIVSVPSIFLSCLALFVFKTLSISQALLYSLAISLIMLGNACYGIEKDIKNPKFKYLGTEEMTAANRNVITSMGLGIVISMVIGAGAIAMSFFLSLNYIYVVLFGFAVPYAIIEFCTLFINLEKKYHNIEA